MHTVYFCVWCVCVFVYSCGVTASVKKEMVEDEEQKYPEDEDERQKRSNDDDDDGDDFESDAGDDNEEEIDDDDLDEDNCRPIHYYHHHHPHEDDDDDEVALEHSPELGRRKADESANDMMTFSESDGEMQEDDDIDCDNMNEDSSDHDDSGLKNDVDSRKADEQDEQKKDSSDGEVECTGTNYDKQLAMIKAAAAAKKAGMRNVVCVYDMQLYLRCASKCFDV
jgi:hypothetical protein